MTNIKTLGRILFGAVPALVSHAAPAATTAEISRNANATLQQRYASVPAAKALGAKAKETRTRCA